MAEKMGGRLSCDLESLFSGVGLGSFADGRLLEAFLAGRADEPERAFEEIVRRHGPMVHRLCRQVLGDRHEAEDAFQAVFLVLARSARKVRSRDSLGSWLHGVALRVSAAERGRLIARRHRERSAEGDEDLDACVGEAGADATSAPYDVEAIHQELSRLPERQRAPIILCYLEGMTHDQAAERLKWPVGTVRSRLARGRERLRSQLERRGVRPAVISSLVGWSAGEGGAVAEAALATRPLAESTLANTVRLASLFARCEVQEGGSFTLAKGVLASMAWQKTIRMGLLLVPAASFLIGGAAIVAQTVSRPGPRNNPEAGQDVGKGKAETTAVPTKQEKAVLISTMAQARERLAQPFLDPRPADLVEVARLRLEAQRPYFEEGRISLDRYVDASRSLMEAEQLAPGDAPAEERGPILRHIERLKQIEARERAALAVGRGTISDLAESIQRRIEEEVRLRLNKAGATASADEVAALRSRVAELEKKLDQVLKKLPDAPR